MAKARIHAADAEQLVRLHQLLTASLLAAFEGERRPSAATMTVARRFLMDNGVAVTTGAVTTRDQLELLRNVVLPFAAPKGSPDKD